MKRTDLAYLRLTGMQLLAGLTVGLVSIVVLMALFADVPGKLPAAVIAVHHLRLGLILPDWVFTGGGSIGRIALHAAILVVEAATLMWVAQRIIALLAAIEAGRAGDAGRGFAVVADLVSALATMDQATQQNAAMA